jgi:hypothetical protein
VVAAAPTSAPATTSSSSPAAAAAATRPAPDPRIDALVARLDNGRLRFSFRWWTDGKGPQWVWVYFDTGIGRSGTVIEDRLDEDELMRELVKAMDDPAKTAAAHCELYRRGIFVDVAAADTPDLIEAATPPAGPFVYDFGGLAVELTRVGDGFEPDRGSGPPHRIYRCEARIDPAQFPALRARWQKRVAARDWKWPSW